LDKQGFYFHDFTAFSNFYPHCPHFSQTAQTLATSAFSLFSLKKVCVIISHRLHERGIFSMASIQLHNDCPVTTTCIPNTFIDRYMPEANGEFVKVYLYLLRCVGNHALKCSISAIADTFNHTEKDVIRALKYWERMHLIRLETGADKVITGIHLLNIEEAATDYAVGAAGTVSTAGNATADAGAPVGVPEDAGAGAAAGAVLPVGMPQAARAGAAADVALPVGVPQTAGAIATAGAGLPAGVLQTAGAGAAAGLAQAATLYQAPADRRTYTADEIKTFSADPNITELFFIIETYLKHPLTSTDTNIILYWYDQLQFSSELIIYLVEYCISKGHSSMRYMDKVALGWHESGIRTVEQAKENAAIHSQAYYAVMKALGITGRNLVDSEVAFVNKWSREYAFDLPLIQEACGRTITAIHQPSFEYTDSILNNWYKNQVHTLEDVKTLDAAYSKNKKSTTAANTGSSAAAKRNRFNNFDQREYDFNQLEKMLLTTSVQ
jgi:DnaD/phage-associated family protein